MSLTILFIPLLLALLYGLYKLWYASTYRRRDIHNRTVLITGGGRGLGRLQAERFAKLGAKLILWDINEETLQDAANELSQVTTVKIDKVDISDPAQVTAASERAGPIDYLINNAGIAHIKDVVGTTDAEVGKLIAINLLSHFTTIRTFLPGMVENKFGHITCIASGAGHVGIQWLSEYCASKHGLVGLMESLRFEIMVKNEPITTTTICPLFVSTPLLAEAPPGTIGSVLTPEAVADRIVDATLRGEEMVLIPESLSILLPLIRLLPVKLQEKLLGPSAFGVLTKLV
jgi:all-trans-retinol dehydrogenase (NAD+)